MSGNRKGFWTPERNAALLEGVRRRKGPKQIGAELGCSAKAAAMQRGRLLYGRYKPLKPGPKPAPPPAPEPPREPLRIVISDWLMVGDGVYSRTVRAA